MVQWSSQPDEFAQVCQDYIAAMLGCGHMVMRAMALSLGLAEDYFGDKLTNDSYWIMRMIGYPPLKSAYDGVAGVGMRLPSSGSEDLYYRL